MALAVFVSVESSETGVRALGEVPLCIASRCDENPRIFCVSDAQNILVQLFLT